MLEDIKNSGKPLHWMALARRTGAGRDRVNAILKASGKVIEQETKGRKDGETYIGWVLKGK